MGQTTDFFNFKITFNFIQDLLFNRFAGLRRHRCLLPELDTGKSDRKRTKKVVWFNA